MSRRVCAACIWRREGRAGLEIAIAFSLRLLYGHSSHRTYITLTGGEFQYWGFHMSLSTASRRTETRISSPPMWQVALVVLAAGIPAFLLGPVLWPDAL